VFGLCVIAAVGLTLVECARAQMPPAAEEKPAIDPVTGDVRLPGILVRAKEQTVEVEGKVCLNQGILEFFAVVPEGREYESVVSLNCKPSNLKAALLLIGCEEGGVSLEAQGLPVRPGAKQPKIGDRLRITVEWKDGDKTVRVPAEQLLFDRRRRAPPKDLPWTFTGSGFGKDFEGHEIFLADVEEIFISLWHNPSALINLDVNAGNPYRSDAQGFEINKALIPKVETPIKLIIERVTK
jgi:hypothetical protein